MNQFKKAKQKAIESGHQVENIKDLQTAGVKTNAEEKKTHEEPVISEPIQASEEIQVTVELEPVHIETPVIAEPIPVHAETAFTSDSIDVPAETPVTATPIQVHTEIPVMPIAEPAYEDSIAEPIITVQQPTPVPVPVRVAPVPVVQEVTYTTPVATSVQTASKASAAKKSVPNIFAPKNEAKSMRKSLVLKPTSVKIAENYCAKNGGSFNELIQTLLDNFIDEYGL